MYLNEQLNEKWSGILDHEALPKISDPHKRAVTALILENQEKATAQERGMLNEADMAGNAMSNGTIDKYDPILISLVRRAMPNLMAYDLAGVQPMTGPTGLIFAMRTRYGKGGNGPEALFREADTGFSGAGAHTGSNPVEDPYTTGTGMTLAEAEALGTATGGAFGEMSFSIDRVSVVAKTRALKAGYTIELAQDLKAVHGLDAESELSNILSQEIVSEINREVVRTIYHVAKVGAATTATPGTFDLDVDSNGRWSVERFKGLMFQIEREANHIAQDTRRGKGNYVVCSADVASALAMAGVLDYGNVLAGLNGNMQVDDMGNTFAGILNGRFRVYVDPFSANLGAASQYVLVGYKGVTPYDAGIYFAPYTGLQMVRAVSPDTFQPAIAFKTRYGLVANPFVFDATGNPDGDKMTGGMNQYFRKFKVTNLL